MGCGSSALLSYWYFKSNLNPKKTASRRRDKTLRNGALSTYRRTFFPVTSSDLVYPGNPPSNRLYLQSYIRINVPEELRIKANLLNRVQGCFPDHWTGIVYTYSLQQSDHRRIAHCAEGLNGALCAKAIACLSHKYEPVFNQFGVVSFSDTGHFVFASAATCEQP